MAKDDGRKKHEALQTQVEQLQTEIMNVQIKYQKELEKLEKENRELRQQYLIMKTNRKTTRKKIKVGAGNFGEFIRALCRNWSFLKIKLQIFEKKMEIFEKKWKFS